MKVDSFFDMLWKDYVQIAPQAQKIQDIFTGLGETVFNDHVAFRTFSIVLALIYFQTTT